MNPKIRDLPPLKQRGQIPDLYFLVKKKEILLWLVKENYSYAEQVELVQNNLNTHTYGSFYDHLPADESRALTQKLNSYFTPEDNS